MWIGIGALFAGAFLGHAILPTAIKLGTDAVPPLMFSALRFVFAAFLFAPLFFIQKGQKLSKKDIYTLTLLSLFCGGDVLFFSIGIQYTTTIVSQVIYAIDPLLVVILSFIFLHEKPDRYKIIGLFIAALGLGFLLSKSIDKNSAMTFGSPLGNFLMVLGALSWAVYLVMSKKIQDTYSLQTITFANCSIVACVFLIASPLEWKVTGQIPPISPSALAASLTAAGASIGMYLFVQYGLKKTSAFTASLFQYLGPLLTAITAVPILKEHPTLSLFIGGILILSGVFYATTYPAIKEYREKLQKQVLVS